MDLALEALLSPATSCALSESITVSARFRNSGNKAIPSGESIQLGYSIDGGAIVTGPDGPIAKPPAGTYARLHFLKQ